MSSPLDRKATNFTATIATAPSADWPAIRDLPVRASHARCYSAISTPTGDLDIVVLNQTPPHDVWENDRTWEYLPLGGLDDFRNTPLLAATIADTDADGHREIYAMDTTGSLLRWRREGSAWLRDAFNGVSSESDKGELDAADFDGDGRLELLRVLPDGFAVVDPRTGTTMFEQTVHGLTSAIAVVQSPAMGSAVAVAQRDGITVWTAGPGRHAYLSMTPTGRTETSQMRSNASGLGTVVHTRTAGRWIVLDRLDHHSGPGQSLQPLSVGLAGHEQADFVELEWTDGVSQTELELAAGEHHVIVETQRQLASCPVLFAWNGEAFEFVSDVLGGAALGYLDAPGRYAPPRPVEGFLLDAATLAARDGRYALKLGEPMEENVYLDAARLTVYDVPDGWDIVLDERLGRERNAADRTGDRLPRGRAAPDRDRRQGTRRNGPGPRQGSTGTRTGRSGPPLHWTSGRAAIADPGIRRPPWMSRVPC